MSSFGRRTRAFWASLLCGIVYVGLVPTHTACGGSDKDDCLSHGENCSSSYLEKQGKSGLSCCGSEVCCTLAGGSGVPTCQSPGACD
jgi:hypothetical protein